MKKAKKVCLNTTEKKDEPCRHKKDKLSISVKYLTYKERYTQAKIQEDKQKSILSDK